MGRSTRFQSSAVQKKSPRCRRLSTSIGAAYRIPRIRSADPRRLRPPAGVLARSLRTLRVRFTLAPRPRFESMRWRHKRKAPVAGGFSISIGAAYRIRTYDVLIRSQTLYPAEVTPRLVDYYAHGLNNGQAFFQKKLSNLIFTHLMQSIESILSNTAKATPQVCRHIRKASVTGGFKVQLVRRIGFEPMTF